MSGHVSHPYRTTGRIMVVYICVFVALDKILDLKVVIVQEEENEVSFENKA